MTGSSKTAVILIGMGGPDGPDDIPQYLYNIFSDREIIRLPGGPLLQKPFARLISALRSKKVQSHYNLIGGRSPLLDWTKAQLEHIEFALKPTHPGVEFYIGMRYFNPYIDEVINQAISDGCTQIIFLPMYPQYCKATTGSSYSVAKKTLKGHPDISVSYIADFHDNSDYVHLLRKYIEKNIKPDETLMFSAHSIPRSFVDEGDPYVEQTQKTAQLAANGRDYVLSFQSRTGPVEWVGPDTVEEVTRILDDKNKKLFIVPVSFVCDHIETMYELDIELKDLIGEEKGARIRRMPMFNDDADFASALANILMEEFKK